MSRQWRSTIINVLWIVGVIHLLKAYANIKDMILVCHQLFHRPRPVKEVAQRYTCPFGDTKDG